MAENSPAPDKSKQADGWGMSLFFPTTNQAEADDLERRLTTLLQALGVLSEQTSLAPGIWVFLTSLAPVWEQVEQVAQKIEKSKLPQAKLLLHARAASNKKEIGDIELNRPFKIEIGDEILSFAFNGRIKILSSKILLGLLGLKNLIFNKEANGAQRLQIILA